MSCVTWTVVYNTPAASTALKLLDRTALRLAVPLDDVWLRPCGEDRQQHAARFHSTCGRGPETDRMANLAELLRLAERLSATWTLDLSGGSDGWAAQGWTPHDYQTFRLEGLVAASWILRDRTVEGPPVDLVYGGRPIAEPTRQRVLRSGLLVSVVE